MRKGAVTLSLVLTIAGAVGAAMIWVMQYVESQVTPIRAEADNTAQQINGANEQLAAINAKLDFLIHVYGATYNPQENVVQENTTTIK